MINIIFSEEYKNHDTGNHPESIKRIEVVNNLITEEYSKHNLIEPTIADKEIISLAHENEYINYIFDNIPSSGFTYFDPDTIASPNSLKSYLTQYYTNLNPELRQRPDLVSKFVDSQVAEYNKGRGGYAEGGDTASDNAIQAASAEGLPMRQNPEGIMELDLRNTGGFIQPVGIKEKADDIPAMLSNNEFVFTADAVRGMGEGDVNKGAERMYSMMKNLERGGRV